MRPRSYFIFRKLFIRLIVWTRKLSEAKMMLLFAVVVGLGSGLAAVLLKELISLIHKLIMPTLEGHSFNILYLLYPGIGMFISFLLLKFVIKDDIGHGVTKVLLSLSKRKSRIKAHNTWSSVLTSAITIGFGGSVGTEAPIVYAGAAIGSNIARAFGLSYKNMTILLGCGAAGGLAGIFKAPMAGILFTLEILLFNISMSSIIPFLASTITATVVSYAFLGNAVSIGNHVDPFLMNSIPLYLLLGVFCGFVSLYFTRTTLKLEDKIKLIKNPYTKWAICSAALGLLVFLFPPLFGEGYESLSHLLKGDVLEAAGITIFGTLLSKAWIVPLFFTLALLLKVFSMSFTNAGGGVGGTFGPTLIVGGIAGFVLARIINLMGIAEVSECNFALVGMAGLMSGVMQAPMTAIFLIAEITGGYSLFMPLIITSTISYATIHSIEPYSIYTKRIAKMGALLTHDSDQSVLTLLNTCDLVEKKFIEVNLDDTLGDLVKAVSVSVRNIFPVVDKKGRFQGYILLDDIRKVMFDSSLYDKVYVYSLMKNAPAKVKINDSMESVMHKFETTEAWNLPVVDDDNKYIGFVSKSRIFSKYREKLHLVSHN